MARRASKATTDEDAPVGEKADSIKRPCLADLAGMREARAWGETLARDIAAFRAGAIRWDEVDAGAVLHGPPGTGKTMFAKLLAETCGVKLFATSFAQWIRHDGHLGDTIQAMYRDFQIARDAAPAILFIDELDSLPSRRFDTTRDSWFTSVVNALLEQLSGAIERPGLVVIAACNHVSALDPALVRAGRLERHLAITHPTAEELPEVIKFHLGPEEVKTVGELQSIGLLCQRMTGADIARLVREARRLARSQSRPLAQTDFLAVLEPLKRDREADWRVAVHECGHAIVALELGLMKSVSLSIVAHNRSEGASSMVVNSLALTPTTLLWHLAIQLGGRAAEQIVLGEISGGSGGGPESDLCRANALAWRAITELGMSVRAPLLWCGSSISPEYILTDNPARREVQSLLDTAYERAVAIVEQRRHDIDKLAKVLIDRGRGGHRFGQSA